MTMQDISGPLDPVAPLRAVPDPDSTLEGVVERGWDVEGDELQVVRLEGTVRHEGHAIRVLQEALECSELEAEHAFRVICEDGEFVTSVRGDLDDLPLSAA